MSRICDDSLARYLQWDNVPISAAPFSISIWGKTIDDTDDYQTMLGIGQSGTDHFWRLRLRPVSGSVDWTAEDSSSAGKASTTAVPNVNEWFHIGAVEAASNSRRILLDGANEGTNTSDIVPSSVDTTWIGQLDDGSPSDRFRGPLGHFAIWDAALTNAEIRSLAKGASPKQIRIGNLIRYWPLNGHSPEPSVVGGSSPMTLFGSPPLQLLQTRTRFAIQT
jgi:hypothetical protein